MQIVKQYRPLEKDRKLTELKQDLIFSWFVDHKKFYPNCEDSNYKNVPSQHLPQKCQQALLEMKQLSEEVKSSMRKKFLSCFTKSFKPHLVYFFIFFIFTVCGTHISYIEQSRLLYKVNAILSDGYKIQFPSN